MAWRKQESKQAQTERESETYRWTASQPDTLDDILDEIDSVLEVNAEEFVRSFVQKGGQ